MEAKPRIDGHMEYQSHLSGKNFEIGGGGREIRKGKQN
jgi:hypothetical protein